MSALRILKWSSSMAVKDLGRRKTRAALTILGISIAVLTITAIMSIGLGMQSEVRTFVGEVLGGAVIVRSKGNLISPAIPEYVVPLIRQIEGVNASIPAIMTMTTVGEKMVFVIGIEPGRLEEAFQVSYSSGQALKPGDNDGIMILSTTAESLGIGLNETLYLSPGGGVGGGVGEVFRVVGVMESMGSSDMLIESMGGGMMGGGTMGGAGFITFRAAQSLVGAEGYASIIYVRLTDSKYADSVEQTIEEMFADAKVVKQETILEHAGNILDVVNTVLIGLGGISMVVGSLGVMNTIMISVHERTREIGVLKAIGGERSHILLMFIIEAIYIGLLGGIIGALLGTGGVLLLNQLIMGMVGFEVPILFSWQTYAQGIILAIVVSVLAGLYPSWSAANIRPVEAMKYE